MRFGFALLWAFCLATASFHASDAANFSPSTHFYMVEYSRPIGGGGDDVSIVDMVFSKLIAPTDAERLLREEIARAMALFPTKGTVMAYAWTQTAAGKGSEKRIVLPDGSGYLIFSNNARQVQTEKQHDAAIQKPPQAGKALTIAIEMEFEKGVDGRVRLLGKTNLPHSMQLMLGLRRASQRNFAQDTIEVNQGRLASNWFSDGGKAMLAGLYEVTVSSPLPALQPAASAQ